MTETLPKRAEVDRQHTWDLESIFPSTEAWEAAFAKMEAQLPALAAFQGKLTQSPNRLLQWMQLNEQIGPDVGKLINYAFLQADQDTANQANAVLISRMYGLYARLRAATSFAEPELLAKLTPERLTAFIAKVPQLKTYKHYLDNLQRQKAHVRSAEVEQLLALAGEPLGTPSIAYGMLVDADLKFAPIPESSKDNAATMSVEQGNIDELLHSTNRTMRKRAWESYADGFIGMKNTLAAIYSGKVKASAFNAQARGFKSTLEASLFTSNVPVKVYQNVIDACNRHLPIWHRYWDIRRRALKLKKAETCDIFAPLSKPVRASYSQAVEWICEGMAPLGEDYVETVRRGCTTERWVDVYPNQGKRNGAYSSGSYHTRPFILMSYSDAAGLPSMSTLAHELGHSMHSLLSNRNQPYIYSEYSLFVAEVASNFNQAMVRAHLVNENQDRNFQIGLIEEAMGNFHRYLFLMPILSQWEQHVHGQIEKGNALSADDMSQHLAALFKRGYGEAMTVDEAREGITWAQFSHFYSDFYVFQYASGIAAANALADAIVQSEGKAREQAVSKYLKFLGTGGSKYPLEALKTAGIDMTKPEAMDRAFKVLEGFVDRLEKLI